MRILLNGNKCSDALKLSLKTVAAVKTSPSSVTVTCTDEFNPTVLIEASYENDSKAALAASQSRSQAFATAIREAILHVDRKSYTFNSIQIEFAPVSSLTTTSTPSSSGQSHCFSPNNCIEWTTDGIDIEITMTSYVRLLT